MTDVLISAGHHPERPGATAGDFVEHYEAVLWRDRVLQVLDGVVGGSVPTGILRDKVAFVNSVRPRLAVEIHFNDAWLDRNRDGEVQLDEHVGRGSETLYMPGSELGELAATYVQAELARVFPPDRGYKEGWYRMDPKYGPDFFLARTVCPALIIEPEFVGNAQKIRDCRESGCAAIAAGIVEAVRAFQRR